MEQDIVASLEALGQLGARFPVSFARSQFRSLRGCDEVLLDNAGGSQIATQRRAASTAAFAEFINAADPDEIVYGPSTTQLFNSLALAMEHSIFAADPPPGLQHDIVCTNVDHEANVGCWERLAQRSGGRVVLRWWKLHEPSQSLRVEDLESLLSAGGPGANRRTRLVCFTHCSNILGSLKPEAAEAAAVARRHGALSVVDGVGHAPHRATDVRALGADFYCFSTYKVFGPHGAVLYGRRALLEALASLNHRFVPASDLPYRLQPGGPNYELSYGAVGLIEYLEALAARCCELAGVPLAPARHARIQQAFAAIAGYEERLASRLLSFLQGRRGVRIVGPADASRDSRVSTVSFVVEGRRGEEVVGAAEAAGVGVRSGHFYAQRLVEEALRLPVNGSGGVDPARARARACAEGGHMQVRVSMLHYNTESELGRLLGVLAAALPPA
eukprot:tig00001254_g7819.t1